MWTISQKPPFFSLVLPLYNCPPRYVRECLASVRRQRFRNWELIVVDDGSRDRRGSAVARRAALRSRRITYVRRAANGGIVVASNEGISRARGEFVAFLDHDDLLERDALRRIHRCLAADETADFLYTDEYVLRSDGALDEVRKPEWSPERLRTQNYLGHLSVFRRSLLGQIGHLTEGFDGAQDYELSFRATEKARRIVHLSEPLYKWRDDPSSYSRMAATREATMLAGCRAVEEHCRRVGIPARVSQTDRDFVYRVERELTSEPLVSVIIVDTGRTVRRWGSNLDALSNCLRSLAEVNDYRQIEVVIVGCTNRTRPPRTFASLPFEVQSVQFPRPTDNVDDLNISDCLNHGVVHCNGERVLILSDCAEIAAPGTLREMVGLLQEESAGVVGGLVVDDGNAIVHCGHGFIDGAVVDPFIGRVTDGGTDPYVATYQREVASVSRFAMMCRADVFREVGGFSVNHPVHFADVDFCLKIAASERRVILCPAARFTCPDERWQPTSHERTTPEPVSRRWQRELQHDPYHPQLPHLFSVQR